MIRNDHDGQEIHDGVYASLPYFPASVKGLCRRKSDVFYGEDDVADLMFREEEDTVMRAYRIDETMRSLQNKRQQRRRSCFFCFECFEFLRLIFSRDRNS
ncbi:unnamed protein product [Cochlearia groenlandica]